MKAKKSLGQNFLTSKSIRETIIDAADISGNDIILEIGPGKGFLTEGLINFSGKVMAIEKDKDMINLLKERFSEDIKRNRLEILNEDILDFDPNVLSFYKEFNYKIVANIPYYITGAILKKFLTAKYKPNLMVLMLQKEVAQRIMARDKKESLLSMSVKTYGKPKIVRNVSKKYFKPQPKVDSAVLLIDEISDSFFKNVDEKCFFDLIKAGFSHKRKMLLKNLVDSKISDKNTLNSVFLENKIDTKIRAEKLSTDDWQKIYKKLFTKN